MYAFLNDYSLLFICVFLEHHSQNFTLYGHISPPILKNILFVIKDNFGRDASGPKAFVKFPSHVFKDFSPNGSLSIILNTLLNYAQEQNWNDFDLQHPSKRDAMMSALADMEKKLIAKGLLSWPKIVFHQAVPASKIAELTDIIYSHRGTVVDTIEEATHLVEWDDELDGSTHISGDEEYIRTVQVQTGVDSCEALVHWWYYPDSYDEWVPLADLDCSDPPGVNVVALKGTRKWRVCCRYVVDVKCFNEWVRFP